MGIDEPKNHFSIQAVIDYTTITLKHTVLP